MMNSMYSMGELTGPIWQLFLLFFNISLDVTVQNKVDLDKRRKGVTL